MGGRIGPRVVGKKEGGDGGSRAAGWVVGLRLAKSGSRAPALRKGTSRRKRGALRKRAAGLEGDKSTARVERVQEDEDLS